MKKRIKGTNQEISWFNLHAWLGYKLCIFMVIICATVTLATISHEIDWLINPMIRVDPMEKPIQWDEMQKNFEESHPSSRLSYLAVPLYPSFATIGLMQTKDGKNRRIFFNPYSGEIIGDLPWYASFQRIMRDLHRFLLIPINLSLYLVSSFGFVLFVSLITGLFVYKKWWSGYSNYASDEASGFFLRFTPPPGRVVHSILVCYFSNWRLLFHRARERGP